MDEKTLINHLRKTFQKNIITINKKTEELTGIHTFEDNGEIYDLSKTKSGICLYYKTSKKQKFDGLSIHDTITLLYEPIQKVIHNKFNTEYISINLKREG